MGKREKSGSLKRGKNEKTSDKNKPVSFFEPQKPLPVFTVHFFGSFSFARNTIINLLYIYCSLLL